MQSRSNGLAEGRRPPSLRRLGLVSAIVLATMAILAAIALVWTTSSMSRSVEMIVADTRGVYTARQLNLSLLTYQRVSNLYIVTEDEDLEQTRSELASEMQEVLAQADATARLPNERELLDEVSTRLSTFLRQRERLEAQETSLEEIVHLVRPAFERVNESLGALHDLYETQVTHTSTDALREAKVSTIVGVSAAAVLVLGLLALGLVIHHYALRPMLELNKAIIRFQGGDTSVRAGEEGLREVTELATAFNEMAEAMARQRDDQLTFLAGIAHDLRNPLSGLKLGLHALARAPAEPQRSRTRVRLDRQVDRLARLVEDLLYATRIEAGKFELRIERFDARDVVRDMVELYAPTCPHHEVVAELPETPVVLEGDPLRIEQVVSNLLSNGIKYSPSGGPVRVTVQRKEEHVVIAVSDCGIGIAPSDLSKIFLPFRRNHPGTVPGAGLGLSVVRRIVQAHGGHVEVESKPGVGATFRVWLPRTREQLEQERSRWSPRVGTPDLPPAPAT